MSRPTKIYIDTNALRHNVLRVKESAPGKKIIAMVKANAYGCGLDSVLPVLNSEVDAFGVACVEEAMAVRNLGVTRDCILFQGLFSADELPFLIKYNLQCVIHQQQQLNWILNTPLEKNIKIWVKVNTGMHRLGFECEETNQVISQLLDCPWVDREIGLMTHLACADEPKAIGNQKQLQKFDSLLLPHAKITRSIANSAAILALPEMHADVIRPGIMLYGASPFLNKSSVDIGLKPVMHFISKVTAIHHYPPHSPVGYGGIWQSDKPSIIGVVAAGYGDGYPRHINENTSVWIKGRKVPIIGRVSMDTLTVDLTLCPDIEVGEQVELWGENILVEEVAKSAGTIVYELLSQVSPRVRSNSK